MMNLKERVVCVVDDDPSAREGIARLASSAGWGVEAFASAQEYLAAREGDPPGCLVLDINLPGLNGLELQKRLGRGGVDVPIVFVSGHGDIPTSVQALKAGAADFFAKPFDPRQLLTAIGDAVTGAKSRFPRPLADSVRHGAGKYDCGEKLGIVGKSQALDEVLAQVHTVARTDSTVLVCGETGTGKELVARAIHEHSDRKQRPFVKVNCAAIPSGLLESELMGHEKGAFSGAIAQRVGRFEQAHGGTLFLDEIGEIASELQPKLLRLLQEREFERVGGTRTIRADVRLIAATNRNLGAMVKARTFREDLYYRLDVFPITLPPLRHRREDIPALAEHFMRRVAARLRKDLRALSPTALARLREHDWPGNIRELENVIERAVILAEGSLLEIPPFSSAAPPEADVAHADDLAGVNRSHILGVLEATGWIVAGPHGAAARLGVKRSTLNYRMKKLGISTARGRAAGSTR
jgi:DNA-binding NtrC family response regulator